jgi:acyl carrier protein
MDVEQELRTILKKKLKEGVEIEGSSKLTDAGLDSLDLVEIVFDIEDRFKIQLPQIEAENTALSFRNLCNLVEQQLADRPAAASEAQPASGPAE